MKSIHHENILEVYTSTKPTEQFRNRIDIFEEKKSLIYIIKSNMCVMLFFFVIAWPVF